MNVFIIARGYPTTQDPTWGCFEKDQAEALAQLGHQVCIIYFDNRLKSNRKDFGLHRIHNNGVTAFGYKFIPSRSFGWSKKIFYNIENWELERAYLAAVKEFGQPDVLYSHYLYRTYHAIFLKKKYGIPLVAIEHWSKLNENPLEKSIQQMGECAYANTDQVITVCAPLKECIQNLFNTNSLVVHNMIGKEFNYSENNNYHTLTIVSTGRLIYGKGFDLLINALNCIRYQLSNPWRMIIIGNGKQKKILQELINSLQLQEHIFLLGQKNKNEIVQILQQSDIFVLPSRGENFSVAVLEALACGVPVIASICGGIRECINSNNGLLFPVDNVEALASALQHMIQNLHKYDRQAIARDCQNRFSSEVIAKQLTDIFEETIKRHKEQE